METIKTLITNDPILIYPNYEKKFTLTTDASNIALGAVLSQDRHPICFASRTLNEHEINYSATEKELLALVYATKYFISYLYGRSFEINSDHRPLQWLHNLKEPNMKLQKWKLKLNEFNFTVKYIPGRENHVADALSRVRIENCCMNSNLYKYAGSITKASKTKILRSTKFLKDVTNYDRFKEIVLELHLKGMHQGIDKIQLEFRK